MIILAGFGAAIAVVLATGGDLRRLASVRLRGSWLVLLAVTVQTALVGTFGEVVPAGSSAWIHVATYAMAATFLWMNRAMRGVPLIALGGGMNAVAVALNGGVMPASAWALRTAGLQSDGAFENSGLVRDARLPWLGDVLAVPRGWPLANVFSIGDIVLVVAAYVVLHGICGSRHSARRRVTVPSSPMPATSSAVPR